jgi:hypothetical protein
MKLSTDKKYLYEMCLSIKHGHVSTSLASKSTGARNHSGWLSTANRILRLFVSTQTPHKTLEDLVNIIMQIYATGYYG